MYDATQEGTHRDQRIRTDAFKRKSQQSIGMV